VKKLKINHAQWRLNVKNSGGNQKESAGMEEGSAAATVTPKKFMKKIGKKSCILVRFSKKMCSSTVDRSISITSAEPCYRLLDG